MVDLTREITKEERAEMTDIADDIIDIAMSHSRLTFMLAIAAVVPVLVCNGVTVNTIEDAMTLWRVMSKRIESDIPEAFEQLEATRKEFADIEVAGNA